MKRVVLLVVLIAAVSAMPVAAFDHFTSYNPPTGSSKGAAPGAALDATNSIEATIGYALETKPTAQVTISIPGVPYVHKAQWITKGTGVVKERFSALCGPNAHGKIAVGKITLTMWDAAKNKIATSDEGVQYTFTCPVIGRPPAVPRPDLVITSFGMTAWGKCAPGQAVYTFGVTVKNQGLASWTGAEPAVVIKDMHPGVVWSVGIGIDPPLAAGESRNMSVPVLYLASNPAHMLNAQPHPFRATVNENHVVPESNYANNAAPGPATWGGMQVIMMGAPQGCVMPTPEPPR